MRRCESVRVPIDVQGIGPCRFERDERLGIRFLGMPETDLRIILGDFLQLCLVLLRGADGCGDANSP